MVQDVSGGPVQKGPPPNSHTLRVAISVDGKDSFTQEFVVPSGLTKKLAAQVIAQLVGNGTLKATESILAGLGYK